METYIQPNYKRMLIQITQWKESDLNKDAKCFAEYKIMDDDQLISKFNSKAKGDDNDDFCSRCNRLLRIVFCTSVFFVKRKKDHPQVVNIDDFNERFWVVDLSAGDQLKASTEVLGVEKEIVDGGSQKRYHDKSFLEVRSYLTLVRSFWRVFLLHIWVFGFMLIAADRKLKGKKDTASGLSEFSKVGRTTAWFFLICEMVEMLVGSEYRISFSNCYSEMDNCYSKMDISKRPSKNIYGLYHAWMCVVLILRLAFKVLTVVILSDASAIALRFTYLGFCVVGEVSLGFGVFRFFGSYAAAISNKHCSVFLRSLNVFFGVSTFNLRLQVGTYPLPGASSHSPHRGH